MGNFSYWTKLSEDTGEGWVHALPLGEYEHPLKGKLRFTFDRVKRFAENVNKNVRGIQLDIDYDHKAKTDKAAGWVKQAEARADGLWLLVEWTDAAKAAIKSKEYRYFSSEYADEWEDNTGNKFTDVLFGGGLTNRPFMKNLVPINLSEVLDLEPKGNVVDRNALIQLLGLGEDASDDAITNAIKTAKTVDLSKLALETQDGKLVITYPEAEGQVEFELPKPEAEEEKTPADSELAALAESNPAVAQLMEQVDHLMTAQKLSEATTKLSEVGKTKKALLPPVVQNALRDVVVTLSDTSAQKLYDAIDKLAEVGFVQLGEVSGKGSKPVDKSGDPVADYNDAVTALTEGADALTFAEAATKVSRENPDLYTNYKQAIRSAKASEVA